MSDDTIPQDQLAEVNNLVDESYNNPQNNEVQQLALRSSLRFLSKLGNDSHIFCNPDLEKAAIKSLMIFAYPNTSHLAAYQSFLAGQLARCPQCPRRFHLALIEFEKIMSDTYNYENEMIEELMQLFEQWNRSRITESLSSTYEKIKDITDPKPSEFQEELIPLFECLCAPRLFRDEKLHDMFKKVFFKIQKPNSPTIRPPELLPGVVMFLFSKDDDERMWAEITVNKIKPSEFSTAATFDAMLVQAIDDVIEEASTNPMSEADLERFWGSFNVLIRVLDRSVFTEKLSGRPHDALRFLAGCILKLPKQSLPATLLAFSKAVDKIGSTIWTLITPVSVEYIVNAIRGNLFFSNPLSWSSDSPGDVISWVNPLLKSCDSTNLQRCGQTIIPLLIDQLGSKGPAVEEIILTQLLNVFCLCLKTEMREVIPFISQVQRLQRTPVKHLVYQHASIILDSYFKYKVTNIHIPSLALNIIYHSILLDVLTGTPENPGLKDSPTIPEEEKPKNGLVSLWSQLNKRLPQDSDLAIHILRALKGVSFIMRPPPRKPTEVQVMPRGIFSSQAIDNAIVSMQLIGEFDKEFLQPVLLDDEALLAIILNTYSVHQEVNQSAVDIFCQAFDADDRLTALSSMLNYDLKRSLAVLTSAVKMVTTVAIFPPCPKLIKVAQDVSQCLFGAQAGILNKKKEGIAFELLSYWQTNWKFLEKMFKTTPKWAVHFKNDFMLEFMRDLLDYSGELVDYYRLLEAMMPADMDESTSTNYLLLNSVIDCLTEMCRLLRLKDESLILSCFNIIVSVLGLMRSFDVKPSKALVQIFVQLSSKARGFENIMTSDQLTRLLVDSGAYTSEEAERVVRGSTPEEKEVVEVRQVKKAAQRSIMDFARPGAVQRLVGKPIPPVVQAISGSAAPRTSMMDTLRAEVKSRNALKPIAPSKEIHPARPPGFNNSKFGRKAAVESKTATGSSSDEDSSDDSDDDGLFTIKQVLNSNSLHKLRNIEKKPVSAINLGPNHRKVGTDISEKEREERNMMARLQIDLGPLHQQILSWDYHATGDKPIVQKTGQLFATNTRQVPDTFKTVNEYQEVFEPLLMLECWQNIQRSKMEANDKPFKITIANKTLVGNGAYEVRASLPVSSWQECKIGDSDVLVLSYFTGDNVDARYPSKDVPYCLAKIKEIKNTNTDYVELAMRVDNPPLSMHTYLVPLAEFHVLRTVSLTTIEREYCSLRALQYYDLKSEILNALPSKTQDASSERIRKTVSTYNVNESQAKAIISSHYSQGFSLIQGPPGTGKTKTILGIVGSFLTETTSGSPLPPPPAAGQDLKNPDLENLKRILICAPSNAAVDELVLRLKNGVIGHGGKLIKPGIVRLGRSDVINPSVRELTLEELVEQKLNELDDNSNKELMGALRKEQNQTLAERDKLRQEQNATEDPAKREALRLEILALTKTIKATGHKLDLQREQLQVRARKRDIERRKAQAQIIKQSQIICATLSGSAHNVLSSLKMRFDTVIIDEAAQCIELSALIPLKYGCKQCIMVGDPNQLPPTVLSQQAASLKYEQSLFVRMFNKHQDRVHMLNVQFRMHPDIAEFPSKEFYNGKLETGSTNLERTKKVWHDRSLFSPYRFFNVKGSHERSERTKSLFNKKEAMVAFQLYRALENKIGHSEIAGKVGIISPYKQQVNLLKRVFKTELGELGAADIDFNTIDGFQGQEKEVIIISCVRAEPDGYGVGFLGDTRRMNVAVTRAKSALWILGNEESLLKNPVWRRLVADAKQRHCYTDCKPGQLNNLIRNGDQAAHQEKRKFEDDDQSGRKKKKPKSRDDRRVDNRQRNDFNKNRDDKKDRSRNERRDNRPERDARPVDDDDNYEPSLPTGPRQYRDSSSAAATPVQSNYNSRTPSTEHSAAASGSVTPSAQPVGVQNNEPIHEEDGYEPRPASQKPETPVVTGKNDDDDDYEPRPVSQRTVPMKVDDDDSYEPQLGSASLPTSVAPAGGIDDYEPRPPTQRPDVAARNINKVVPLVRRPPPPNQQVRGAPLPLPTMPLPGRPVGPTGVIPPVGPASLMAPSGPAGSSLPTRPSSMKNNSTNMNKFPFNKYQGTAVKKKNRNKKPANVLLPSKRAGPATGNMNTNNNNSNNNKNNNNNNNGPGNNSNRPNNKKNPRNGNNNKPKNKRPGPGPGPGPGAVPSVPTNLNNINNNGRPIPKPY